MIKKSLDVYSLPTKQELILTVFIKLLTDKITKTTYFKQVQGGSPDGYMIIGFLPCVMTRLENWGEKSRKTLKGPGTIGRRTQGLELGLELEFESCAANLGAGISWIWRAC